MNGTEPEPLPADIVDELLSADLDGEFDAAARELGFDPVTAPRRVVATPGSEHRRAALAGARAFVARNAGGTLDDVTRRRLVARALDSTPPVLHHTAHHRTRTWIVRAGVLAGAAAALVGVIVVLGHAGSNTSSKASRALVAAPGTPSTAVAPNAEPSGGSAAAAASVDSSAQLNQFVRGLLRSRVVPDAAAQAASKTPGSTSESFDLQRKQAGTTAVAPTCTERISQALKIGSRAIANAPARYHDQPAAVVVFSTANGPLAVVYDPSVCTVLVRQLAK